MSKTVTFPAAANRQSAVADAWVSGDTGTQKAAKTETRKFGDEKLARLTIDLPQDLHGRFKAACAKGRTKMKDEVLSFIEKWTQEHS
jgi:hypothetical protein